ncbi:tetratricopeptide repeat protein [Anatilimnocola sp. NA78]|uniref:tetratricopeptide repeat protein n=1 Tax=Anatilimnocola sp. NA78 TaxID=3415683 RepID=UPI003CE51C0C
MKSLVTFCVLVSLATLAHAQEEKPVDKPKAETKVETKTEISPFQKPGRVTIASQLMAAAQQAGQAKRLADAEMAAKRAEELAPFFSLTSYNLACFQALQGKKEEALASIERAVKSGFANAAHLQKDDDLASLREDPKFLELVQQVKDGTYKPAPSDEAIGKVADGVATVTAKNAIWDPARNLVRVAFELPEAPDEPLPVIKGHGEVGKKLQAWFAAGTAAGNIGDLYDNSDRDHSNMAYEQFPQLTRIEYAADVAKETGYGVQLTNIFAGEGLLAVIGNSSTAQTAGPLWRSNPRLAYIRPGGIEALFTQYLNNHLYFYPEHRDHDPGHNGEGDGYGDVYAANLPYVIISQGSSGSDRPFMDAIACTLAAFHPDVKQKLVEKQMLMPTVQMIFRRSNKPVKTDEDYLSGIAHPTVFDSQELDVMRMIELAHSLTLETLPPVVMVRVEDEEKPVLGRDYFDVGEREKLFDTPMSVARIWRSTQQKRKFILGAKGIDANAKKLAYHWKVLRGDPSKIEIKPLGDGSRAEISLTWQGRGPIQPESKMESNRIDIGLFAHNGDHYSPPAFFCVNTLDNEERVYDDQGRIKSVTYRGGEEKGNYVDPAFDIPKSWLDEYRYDADGKPLGWTRFKAGKQQDFTADGLLITSKDDNGVPIVIKHVTYVAVPRTNQPPTLDAVVGEAVEKGK